MKTTIRETGKKAMIEEEELTGKSLVYNVVVLPLDVMDDDSRGIKLHAIDLDHAIRIFDAIESSI